MNQINDDTPVFMECGNTGRRILFDYKDAVRIANIRLNEHHKHIKTTVASFHIARLLLNPGTDEDAHHINEDTYDNRRKNLMKKSHKAHSHMTNRKSGSIGVSRHGKRWKVKICYGRKVSTAFTFEDKNVAIRFADWSNYMRFGGDCVISSPGHICSALAAFMILNSGGEVFKVTFVKRTTGELRTMECINATDETMGQCLSLNLILVGEKPDLSIKVIPIEGIKELTIGGKTYKVTEQ